MKVTLFLCVSLDGFIATSDGSSAWPDGAYPNWCGFCSSCDNVVLGRVSYDGLIQNDFSDILTAKHKVVVSSRDLNPPAETWTHMQTPAQAVEHLKACGIANMVVGGGRELGVAFLRAGYIDEIMLDVQPVAFGTGVHLFGALEKPLQLDLLEDKQLGRGALRLRYGVHS